MAMDVTQMLQELITNQDAVRTDIRFTDGTWTHEDIADEMQKAFLKTIIDHIHNNAQLTFRTTDAGIQTSTNVGVATGGPAAGSITLAAGQIS